MTLRSVSAKYPGLEVNYGPGVRYSGKDLGARKIFREKTLIYTSRLLPTSRSENPYFDSIATKVGFASGNKVPIYFKPRGYFSCHGV